MSESFEDDKSKLVESGQPPESSVDLCFFQAELLTRDVAGSCNKWYERNTDRGTMIVSSVTDTTENNPESQYITFSDPPNEDGDSLFLYGIDIRQLESGGLYLNTKVGDGYTDDEARLKALQMLTGMQSKDRLYDAEKSLVAFLIENLRDAAADVILQTNCELLSALVCDAADVKVPDYTVSREFSEYYHDDGIGVTIQRYSTFVKSGKVHFEEEASETEVVVVVTDDDGTVRRLVVRTQNEGGSTYRETSPYIDDEPAEKPATADQLRYFNGLLSKIALNRLGPLNLQDLNMYAGLIADDMLTPNKALHGTTQLNAAGDRITYAYARKFQQQYQLRLPKEYPSYPKVARLLDQDPEVTENKILAHPPYMIEAKNMVVIPGDTRFYAQMCYLGVTALRFRGVAEDVKVKSGIYIRAGLAVLQLVGGKKTPVWKEVLLPAPKNDEIQSFGSWN